MATFDGAVVTRSRHSAVVALGSLGIFVGSIVALCLGVEGAFLGLYAFLPLVVAVPVHLSWAKPMRRLALLEASPSVVRADGAMVRSRIATTRIMAQGSGAAIVELRRRFDPYPARVELSSLAEAQRFVRAIGHDAREGATRFHVPLPSAVTGWAIAAIFLFRACTYTPASTLAYFACAIAALVTGMLLYRRTITIGRDGILLERVGWRRFIPYAQIAVLVREERRTWNGKPMVSRGFYVELRSSERVFVRTLGERFRDGLLEGDYLYDAAVAAHEEAMRAQPVVTASLFKGGRSTADWLRELRTVREARYRVAAVHDDELLGVLADPTADRTARAGAAVCLAGAGEETRARVRVVADEIAAPDLRAAVDAALDGDDEALVGRLDALE